jgi:hypothetical protein
MQVSWYRISGQEMSVVLYLPKTTLRIFGNEMMCSVVGPTGEEAIGRRKELRSVKLHNVYSSPNFIREIR